jgi:hypothetical protein
MQMKQMGEVLLQWELYLQQQNAQPLQMQQLQAIAAASPVPASMSMGGARPRS